MNRASTAPPLTGVKRADVAPICPHCEGELAEIYTRKVRRGPFGMGRGFVFFCTHCRKVFGKREIQRTLRTPANPTGVTGIGAGQNRVSGPMSKPS